MKPFHLYLYGPQQGPIDASFEEAQARLSQLPRLYFEPDGSFVWMQEPGREEIYGMLYDAAGQIRYCDLRGSCSRATWQALCQAITGRDLDGPGDLDGAGEFDAWELEVLLLPEQKLQDLQTFAAFCLTSQDSDRE